MPKKMMSDHPVLHLTPLADAAALRGQVVLPGSKSFTNRALVVAALASGKSTLTLASLSNDSLVLMEGLRHLGVRMERDGDTVIVYGTGGVFVPYKGSIDVGPAGTSMRFLTSVAALVPGGDIVLCGSERMHQRPIGDLVEAWRSLGADIEYLGTEGCPPLRIRGKAASAYGSTVAVPGDMSSQFMTSLIQVAPLLPGGLSISVIGEQVSRSYIDMTSTVMGAFGVAIDNHSYERYDVPHRAFVARDYQVEGDASGGSYFWGLAALAGGSIRVWNTRPDSCQGDVMFPQLLAQMGCDVRSSADSDDAGANEESGWIEVSRSGPLRGCVVDMEQMPDTAMTLAVVAACAEGETTITGLQTLRHKETDRLAAMKAELASVGIESDITEDSITVVGGVPHGALIRTYDDHRMAMSFALLGAVCEGILIADPDVVGKSFPRFWEEWAALGMGCRRG